MNSLDRDLSTADTLTELSTVLWICLFCFIDVVAVAAWLSS